MGKVVGGGAVYNLFPPHGSCAEVVDVCPALGDVVKVVGACKDVVVYNIGAVGDFHHKVAVVCVVEVSAYAYTLGLPVKPAAKGAVVYVVSYNLYVNSCMKLYSCNFVAKVFMLNRNVVDVVVLNLGEDAAHVPNNSVLSAVVDCIVAYYVRPDFFLAPAVLFCPKDSFHLVLVARLFAEFGAVVVPGGNFFAKAYRAALCVVEDAVFYNPALCPVGANHSGLVCRWWCPGTCGLAHFKALDCYVVKACAVWVKAALAYAYFHKLLVGVKTVEVCVDFCFFPANFRKPLVDCLLHFKYGFLVLGPRRIVACKALFCLAHFFQGVCLVKGLSVKVHVAKMDLLFIFFFKRPNNPVAPKRLCKGVAFTVRSCPFKN